MIRRTATQLVRAALKAAARAYCPYSHFRVGAAILADGGKIFTGCNVENASYGLTICAERTAAVTAVAAGKRRFAAVAVAGGRRGAPAFPCGACLQVLAEFGGADMTVLVAPLDGRGQFQEYRLADFMPKAFKLRKGSGK